MDTPETRIPDLISVAAAAKLLNCSRVTVYRRISSGAVPAIRLGPVGPLRVERADLMAWAFGPDDESAA